VWAGLVTAIGGVCGVGVGMMAGATWLIWSATGATLLGVLAAVSETTRNSLARAGTSERPSMRRLAAFGLAAVGGWLVLGQLLLGYPMTSAGQDNALRDSGFAVIILLAALRLRMPSRSRPVSTLCVVSGGLLILSALFLPHDSSFVRIDELAAGLLVVAFGAMSPF
jgi:hypothetical protein